MPASNASDRGAHPGPQAEAPQGFRISKPWGEELHWTPPGAPYVGKVIHINAGARLSLQVHESKSESWLLLAGRASVIWDEAGELVERELKPGSGYTCLAGRRHRLVGITACDILEVSTPEVGTTWRLDDDYARPDETEELRRIERA